MTPVKILTLIALFLLLAALAMVLWIRLAPSDPARWHVDPGAAPDPRSPNFARIETLVALPRDQVLARIEGQALREGAVRLAADLGAEPDVPWRITWVARTRLVKFPDYVSIRLDLAETGTRITAFSRSRFGHGDRGVNAARLERWVGRL